ncbi:Ldh family oxidoreductase [Streptomyces sp. NPDC057430]|uniref:Ldh family oxidoreductase n=1 Tax=Streptomyces sp. NPDC057430 TaxID=3346131 RepID=UPI0036A1FAE9
MVTCVSAARLTVFLERAYRAAGMTRGGARTMAQAHVEAELRGLTGHGIRLAPGYLCKLRTGRLNPRPKIVPRAHGAAVLALDGDLAPGPVAARHALASATIRARQAGVGLVTVRDVGHAGALGVFVTWAARHRMIAVLAAQTSAASVALRGGSGRGILGNSALAIAVPGKREGEPVVVDLAASAMSWGTLHQHAARDRLLPVGTALDTAGQPVRKPADAAVLLPAGERAQAMAIVLELLVGALTGSTPLPGGGEGRGLWSLVIDPRALGASHLTDAVAEVARAVRVDGARMPGDRAWSAHAQAATTGIALDADDLRALTAAAGDDVPIPDWALPFHNSTAPAAGQES